MPFDAHKFDYDYFVIGAGSGGVRSARIAAQNGAKVAIAEGRFFGGTCVNVGCVPKKLLSYGSHFADDFFDAKGFGWDFEAEPTFDWATLIANKNKEIERLNGIYLTLLNNSNVDIYHGYARFIDEHTVEIDGKKVSAQYFLIAVGGKPFIPDHKGAKEHAITSDDIFYLKELPKKLVVVGGGYIAVEFASIMNGFGVDVTLLYRGEMFLRGFDDDIRKRLKTIMENRGIDLRFNSDVSEITAKDDQKIITLLSGDKIMADQILYATGRVPMTETLGLKEANVNIDNSGNIVVDDHFKTSNDRIFAVGDVINRVPLTPVAIQEGHFLADYLFKDNDFSMDYDTIATAVFTTPSIGTVGMSEEKASRDHIHLDIYESEFRPMKYTLSGRQEKTYMKLIVCGQTDRVLGCHMIGPDAPEIIQMAGIALTMKATKADFDKTMALHPCAAEEFVTMRTVSRSVKS